MRVVACGCTHPHSNAPSQHRMEEEAMDALRLTWCTGSCNGFFKEGNQLLLFGEWEEALKLSKMDSIGWDEQRCGEVLFRICSDIIFDEVPQSIVHDPNLVLEPVTNLVIIKERIHLGNNVAERIHCSLFMFLSLSFLSEIGKGEEFVCVVFVSIHVQCSEATAHVVQK